MPWSDVKTETDASAWQGLPGGRVRFEANHQGEGHDMDQQMISRIEAMRHDHPEVDSLMEAHRSLDERVGALTERSHLTPEENVELVRLKKEKLRIKDQLEQMLHARSA
jgi:uncharacterized protein YdcH (DUF465 family)